MAAPKLNKADQERTRAKIQTTQLVKRLQYYALSEKDPSTGEVPELDNNRLKAIGMLLDKSLPSLQASEVTAEVKQETISWEPLSEEEWQEKYGSVATSRGTATSTH